MKRLSVLFLVLLSAIGCVDNGQPYSEILRSRILEGKTDQVLVVAHRGDWRYAPENSLAALEHSIKVGVDIVEIDLQLTKDSVLIAMHDTTLDRTTTGSGKVSEWTVDSIKTLKLKNGCALKTVHTVPTLEEVLLLAKDRVLLNLDKADRYFDLIVPVLEKTGTSRQIIMKGRKPAAEVLSLYGKYLDEIIYMPVVKLHKEDARELMTGYRNLLKPAAYELVYSTDEYSAYPKELKRELDGEALIWYNTLWDTLCGGHDDDLALDDPDMAYGYLIDTLGTTIIQTDRAEYLLDYLRKRNLHD